MPTNGLSNKDWREIRERYEQIYENHLLGLTYAEIGKKLGLTSNRVASTLRYYDSSKNFEPIRRSIELRLKDTWRFKEVLAQYHANTAPGRIARTLNISVSTVRRIIRLQEKYK